MPSLWLPREVGIRSEDRISVCAGGGHGQIHIGIEWHKAGEGGRGDFLPDIDTCAAGNHHGEGAAIGVHDGVHIVGDLRYAAEKVAEMIPYFGEGIRATF